MPLSVGHDDGLEDGLQHGVGELKLHLAASGLGVAQFAQPDRDPVQLAGNNAEIVAAAPLHTVLQVALGNSVGIASQHADGSQNEIYGPHLNHHRCEDEDVCDSGLSRCRQSAVRGSHQPHCQAGKQHAAENQSLGKVEHRPVSVPAKGT